MFYYLYTKTTETKLYARLDRNVKNKLWKLEQKSLQLNLLLPINKHVGRGGGVFGVQTPPPPRAWSLHTKFFFFRVGKIFLNRKPPLDKFIPTSLPINIFNACVILNLQNTFTQLAQNTFTKKCFNAGCPENFYVFWNDIKKI